MNIYHKNTVVCGYCSHRAGHHAARYRADKVMVSGHLCLAKGDFKCTDAVTVRTRRV